MCCSKVIQIRERVINRYRFWKRWQCYHPFHMTAACLVPTKILLTTNALCHLQQIEDSMLNQIYLRRKNNNASVHTVELRLRKQGLQKCASKRYVSFIKSVYFVALIRSGQGFASSIQITPNARTRTPKTRWSQYLRSTHGEVSMMKASMPRKCGSLQAWRNLDDHLQWCHLTSIMILSPRRSASNLFFRTPSALRLWR